MSLPILGIAGWSGCGKTTLLEQLLPRLAARGLTVAVIKHDAHGLAADHPGKDTDRIYRAGATCVGAFDAEQAFLRLRGASDPPALARMAGAQADLVLVEGLKHAPLPKVWLHHPHRTEPMPQDDRILAALEAAPERAEQAERLIVNWLEEEWRRREQWIGILIGGASTRMGRDKALLRLGERALVEVIHEQARRACLNVAFLGAGSLPPSLADAPRLPDAPGVAGPLAGVLSAMRWNRAASWTFLACDLPNMREEFLRWLQAQRRPGAWALVPHLPGRERPEPLAAVYEPPMRARFEAMAARSQFAMRSACDGPKTVILSLPANLAACLVNVNTPEDWQDWVHE